MSVSLRRTLLSNEGPKGAQVRAQASFQKILQAPHLEIYLGEFDGVAVASCYLNVIENLTRGGAPYGVIENVVTHNDYRRRGFGRQIVLHALDNAWKAKCYKVMLMTGRSENVTFYEACGFDANAKIALVARP